MADITDTQLGRLGRIASEAIEACNEEAIRELHRVCDEKGIPGIQLQREDDVYLHMVQMDDGRWVLVSDLYQSATADGEAILDELSEIASYYTFDPNTSWGQWIWDEEKPNG